MEFVIIWALVGLFAARETLPDLTAAVKGNPPPSHERRMQRLKDRGQDTSTEKQPGTIREAWRATVNNAAERAAIKREAKHAGTLRHLEENRERLGEQKYNQLKARAAGKQGTVAAFAKIRRLVTETPERVREARAHRRNASEPDLLDRDDWDPDEGQADANTGEAVTATDEADESDATVLEFRRRNGTESAARRPLSELSEHQAQIVRAWRQANQAHGRSEVSSEDWNSLPVVWRALLLDESERAGNTPLTYSDDGSLVPVAEIDRAAAFLMDETPGSGGTGPESPSSSTAEPDPDSKVVSNPYFAYDPAHERPTITQGELNRRREREDREAAAAERQAERDHELALAQARGGSDEQNPENENASEQNGENMTEQHSEQGVPVGEQGVPVGEQGVEDGPTYETVDLTTTLQRTQASSNACHSQVSNYDQRVAELQSEHTALGTQIAGLEAQIAALQQYKNSGEQIRQLQQAQEQLGAAQNEVAEQITHSGNTLEAYQAAGGFFDGAHAEFSRHTVGQDFYSAENAAGDKEFLTQG